MQPQQQVVVIPQQPAAVVNTNGLSEETLKMRKKILFSLGKVELAIGCLMVSIGIFTTIYVPFTRRNYYYANRYTHRYVTYYYYNTITTFGEGIWCGIWVIIAGGLGMGAGKNNSTPCLINTHMAFSIIGSLACGTLYGLTVTWAIVTKYRFTFYCALMSIFSILSFATAILLIVSASYCCCANPRGCRGGSCDQEAYPNRQYQQRVMYVNVPQVVPDQVQFPVDESQVIPQPGNSNIYYESPVSVPSTNLQEELGAFSHHGEAPPVY